tara:strand:+ start:91 stop:657 length:567 start_codon:yes stop_codon:yes gene_type:complete
MFIEIYETDFLNVSDVIKNAESREWQPALVGGNEGFNVNKDFRDSFIQKYDVSNSFPIHVPVLNYANACLEKYLEKYPDACKFPPFDLEETYNILKYHTGQAYHAIHADYFPEGYLSRRHLTGVCFLSNVSEGGELVFPEHGLEIKPEVGKLVIFPSGWTHSHHTMPVKSDETRYVFQLWWSFDVSTN